MPHFRPKAKRVIFLHQSGGPSQMDLFDYKPSLSKRHGTELPDSIRMGQRITGMTSGQGTLPVAPSMFKFSQHGKSGAWVSELLPHTARSSTTLRSIKTVHTDAINHDPAITFIQTRQRNSRAGRAWAPGSATASAATNENLPAFVVMISQAHADSTPISRCSRGSGVERLSAVESSGRASSGRAATRCCISPIPPGIDHDRTRRRMLDSCGGAEPQTRRSVRRSRDPDAHRAVRDGVPHADLGSRTDGPVARSRTSTFELYGPESRKPGTYAANCLLARRLAERGVRFVQLYHRGWDQHNDLPRDLAPAVQATSTSRRPRWFRT